MFLILHSINWPYFIVWVPLLLEILGNVYYNCLLTKLWRHKMWSELIFLDKPFCYMTKRSRQKLKYLENKKSFSGEIKSIFHHLQRAFSCQKLSQTWGCTFKLYDLFWITDTYEGWKSTTRLEQFINNKVRTIEHMCVLYPVSARDELKERRNEMLNRTHTKDNDTNIMKLLTSFDKLLTKLMSPQRKHQQIQNYY